MLLRKHIDEVRNCFEFPMLYTSCPLKMVWIFNLHIPDFARRRLIIIFLKVYIPKGPSRKRKEKTSEIKEKRSFLQAN